MAGSGCIDHALRNLRNASSWGGNGRFMARMRRVADAASSDINRAIATGGAGIPAHRADGTLPPGVWRATRDEVASRFATDGRRQMLWQSTGDLLDTAAAAGVEDAFIGGSFVTSKAFPADVDVALLTDDAGRLTGPLADAVAGFRSLQVNAYPAQSPPGDWSRLGPHMGPESSFFDLFTHDRMGAPKGIVHIDLTRTADGAVSR